MGKKMRSYRVFVLFLLMSMSVFGKLKVMEIDLSGYPRIVLTLNGNNNGGEVLEFKENNGDYIKEYSGLRVYNKRNIDYTSTLNLNPGEEVTINFFVNFNRVTYKYNVPEKPKNIEIKTYEEIHGWGNGERTTIKDDLNREYVFTKGGDYFQTTEPIIYVVIPEDNIDDKGKIKITKFRVEKLNSGGNVIGTKNIEVTKTMIRKGIALGFMKEEVNIVMVTPISKSENRRDIEGESKILNFIVDTKVNSSYLDNEDIISKLEVKDGKHIIKIKLSEFKELSGINKYSYILSSGLQRETKEGSVDGRKYLTPTKDVNLDDVEIPLGDFSEGSRLTLSFTVYDRLGHKKTFEKTYFIPKQSNGIIAKVSGEVKQRESRIKIITEGNKDKFGIRSSIDGSSEEDETTISGS
jgi:hypothetical protein